MSNFENALFAVLQPGKTEIKLPEKANNIAQYAQTIQATEEQLKSMINAYLENPTRSALLAIVQFATGTLRPEINTLSEMVMLTGYSTLDGVDSKTAGNELGLTIAYLQTYQSDIIGELLAIYDNANYEDAPGDVENILANFIDTSSDPSHFPISNPISMLYGIWSGGGPGYPPNPPGIVGH